MRTRLLLACAALAWLASPAGLRAHGAATARLGFEAPGAAAGIPVVVLVQFEPAEGIDEEMRDGGVSIVATMTGHAMPPVEVTLAPAGVPGRYRGEMTFTMTGPWRLWLRAEGVHGVTLGTAGIELGTEPAPTSKVMALVQQPSGATPAGDEPPPFSPWSVMLGAAGLTMVLWSTALVRKLIVMHRQQPAP